MKRGPKPKPPELKANFKNIAVDADMAETLAKIANDLETVFGFRPTLSQTLRHLLKKVPQ